MNNYKTITNDSDSAAWTLSLLKLQVHLFKSPKDQIKLQNKHTQLNQQK